MLARPFILALALAAGGLLACGPAGGPGGDGRRLYTADLAPNPGSGLSQPDREPPPPETRDPACPLPTLGSVRDEILLPLCKGCHTGALAPEGLDLSLEPTELLARLAEPAHGSPSGMPLLSPGRRGGSYLYLKTFLETPLSGERMPKDDERLSACQLAALGEWIDAGAQP